MTPHKICYNGWTCCYYVSCIFVFIPDLWAFQTSSWHSFSPIIKKKVQIDHRNLELARESSMAPGAFLFLSIHSDLSLIQKRYKHAKLNYPCLPYYLFSFLSCCYSIHHGIVSCCTSHSAEDDQHDRCTD
jgi:hypothetical protein